MPIDTDYNAYVIVAYSVAGVALAALLVWSAMRVAAAQRKLTEAEKDDAA